MSEEQFKRIQEICATLDLSQEQLLMVKNHMMAEIKLGLKGDVEIKTPLKCWPTFVKDFPNGCEHGTFLVVDLGDSSFRINLYHLKGESDPSVEQQFYEIPQELFESENVELFDHISQCLQKFLAKNNRQRDPLPLAFTFPFPLQYDSLVAAKLTQYTKRFNFADLVDADVGKAINESIKTKNPRVETVALLNDATGVLLSCSWRNPRCKIGVVVGSLETSASYVENTEEIEYCNNGLCSKPTMVVHTDWGAFGETGTLEHVRTDLDRQIDKNTSNEGLRLYEKIVSGSYAAEMARKIFLICAEQGILFGGQIGRILQTPFSFTNRHVVEVLSEAVGVFDNTSLMFDRLGVMKPGDNECTKVRYILESVTRRSAVLVAAGIACLLDKIGRQHTVIGIDGSFYNNNPVYHETVQQVLSQLMGDECTFELKQTEDGSGKGAAILAAITLQQKFVYQGR